MTLTSTRQLSELLINATTIEWTCCDGPVLSSRQQVSTPYIEGLTVSVLLLGRSTQVGSMTVDMARPNIHIILLHVNVTWSAGCCCSTS